MLGYPDQAQSRADAALHLARQLPHPYTRAFAFNNVAAIYTFLRRPAVVARLTTTAIAIADEHDFPQQMAQGMILRGWSRTLQGEGVQGIGELCDGLTLWKTLGTVLHLSYFPLLLAEAYAKAGDPEAGLTAVAEALAATTTYNDRYWEAETLRLHGVLLRMAGKSVHEAESAFQQALVIARRQQAKSLELRAAVSLCRLWQDQGQLETAHDLLSDLYHWFTEGFNTVDLQEAKVLLEELQA
jgi:predicted ATPase